MLSYLKKFINIFKHKKIKYEGVILPPRYLRFCGDNFKNDDYFLKSAIKEAERLKKQFNMSENCRVLDLGCGPGRLAIGINKTFGKIAHYQGVDVDKVSIDWCNRYIHRYHPNCHFLRINIQNERYNPDGEDFSTLFKLPFQDHSFNIIYLYSVFSHLMTEDVIIYLKEFYRLLDKQGKIFLTAFTEENVPEVSVNPPGYRRASWKGPLHCVRFNKQYFLTLLKDNGFELDKFEYEKETHGQSAFYLTRRK
jgi:SAM-dependent methyltransferase